MTEIKINAPTNRLIGDMPKVGIRPTIDGRWGGVRESLEDQTMDLPRRQQASCLGQAGDQPRSEIDLD
jgi:hypothetical protein